MFKYILILQGDGGSTTHSHEVLSILKSNGVVHDAAYSQWYKMKNENNIYIIGFVYLRQSVKIYICGFVSQ